MKNIQIIKHGSGALGLRLCGLGPKMKPMRGLIQLKKLFDENTFWAKGRSLKKLKMMLSKSTVVITVWKENKLIGLGRATSDYIFRSVLWDIVVEKKYQKYGIGKLIVTSILENNVIANVEKIYIMTTNCEIFYLKMGFETERDQTLMMLKTKK